MNISAVNYIKFTGNEQKYENKTTSSNKTDNKNNKTKLLAGSLTALAVIGTSICLYKTKKKPNTASQNEMKELPMENTKEVLNELAEKVDDTDIIIEKFLREKKQELDKIITEIKELTKDMEQINMESLILEKVLEELSTKINAGENIYPQILQTHLLKAKNLQLKFNTLNGKYDNLKNKADEIKSEIKKRTQA